MNPEETKEFISKTLNNNFKVTEENLVEFKRDDAGEKLEYKDFHDAVEKLYDKYKNGEISAYCDNVLPKPLTYKGQELELCLVIGGEIVETKDSYEIVYKSGLGHSFQNHSNEKVNDEIVTEEQLKGAIKLLPAALKHGERYDEDVIVTGKDGEERVVTRLLIDYSGFVYIIAFAEDESEINYLLNTFKADRGYINRSLKNGNITSIEKG